MGSLTGWRDNKNFFGTDSDHSDAFVYFGGTAASTLGTEPAFANTNRDDQQDFSQEIRIASPSDAPFRVLAGLYYFKQKFRSQDITFASGTCAETFDYQITEPPVLMIMDTLVTPVKCFGENNGASSVSSVKATSVSCDMGTCVATFDDSNTTLCGQNDTEEIRVAYRAGLKVSQGTDNTVTKLKVRNDLNRTAVNLNGENTGASVHSANIAKGEDAPRR